MPSQTAARLREMRLLAWLEAGKLAEGAAMENRAFTQAEQLLWVKLNQELDVLDRKLRAVLDLERRSVTDRPNPDHPWKARVNYARRDPPPHLPAGCQDLVAF